MTYFTVRAVDDNRTHESFATRQAAKTLRDKMNGGKWDAENTAHKYVVSRTDEHRHGASGSISQKRTQSQRKKK